MLRVALRKLYIRTDEGQMKEIQPLSVLDFYINELFQRRGHGKTLFDEMLKSEGNVHPAKVAYDRPSIKLMGFLAKHFGLRDYLP